MTDSTPDTAAGRVQPTYCCYGEGCETCRPDLGEPLAEVLPQNCGYPGCPAEASDEWGHAHG